MSVVSTIYDTLVDWTEVDEEAGMVSVSITYGGNRFVGTAFLHPHDKDFFSHKVGRQIATSRARTKALKHEYEKAKMTYNNKYTFYQEVLGFGSKAPAEVDPTGALLRNVIRAERRTAFLKEAIEREEANLRNYLEGQAKAISSILRFRNKDKEKDNNN